MKRSRYLRGQNDDSDQNLKTNVEGQGTGGKAGI